MIEYWELLDKYLKIEPHKCTPEELQEIKESVKEAFKPENIIHLDDKARYQLMKLENKLLKYQITMDNNKYCSAFARIKKLITDKTKLPKDTLELQLEVLSLRSTVTRLNRKVNTLNTKLDEINKDNVYDVELDNQITELLK